jgi:hypothetical protein
MSADANAVPGNNQLPEFVVEPGMIFANIESDEDETFEQFQSKVLQMIRNQDRFDLSPEFSRSIQQGHLIERLTDHSRAGSYCWYEVMG